MNRTAQACASLHALRAVATVIDAIDLELAGRYALIYGSQADNELVIAAMRFKHAVEHPEPCP